MYVLLWLLLPVAAATGWWLAKHPRFPGQTRPASMPPEYFRGLNYILNEQPDQAIEVFSRLLDHGAETVELHLAVGNLFRRRGEVDRAIRIHQQLLTHSGISDSQRHSALLELGDDYVRAGLLDRAEQLLQELLQLDPSNKAGLALLRDVYQQEKDWVGALEVAHRLAASGQDDMNAVIAHYHCELAESALSRRDFLGVQNHIAEALKADSQCVRASFVEGRLRFDEGEYEAALAAYERLLKQDPSYVGEVIERMAECLYKQGKGDGVADYLLGLLRRYPSGQAALVVTHLLKQQHSEHDAAVFLSHFLSRTPSLQGLLTLVDLSVASATGESRDAFRVAKSVLERVLERQPAYRCRLCGFSGKVLHWQCPSCKNWNSVRPLEITGLDIRC